MLVQNLDALEQRLLEVSDPSHPKFAQHLSLEEVDDLIRPKTKHLATVLGWLRERLLSGGKNRAIRVQLDSIERALALNVAASPSRIYHSSTRTGDWISLTIPLGKLERLLRVQYDIFEHTRSGKRVLRTTQRLSVAANVSSCIDFLSPTHRFPHVAVSNQTHTTGSLKK